MPYIGNQPFGKTVRTVTTETIASAKTAYYPNGGYMAGYVDVYVNGVRLSESLDFTATDGSLVTLLYTPNIGDTVEIVTYGSVEIANAVRRSGDTFSGNVYVGSNVYISTSTISVGNATVNTQITAGNIALNGSTLTIGNSTVNTVFTGDTVTVGGTLSLGNTAITGTANVTTAINVGANVSMNATSIRVGNSTINTYIVSDTIYGPSTLYIDPAAAGDNTGLVVVKGDLQVDGTTFTINSANVTVNDKNVVLASGAINNAATDGAGLTIYGTNANLTYNATGNNFEMSRGLSVTGTANVSVAFNVGANVNLSTSQINIGNSTVNTTISATALTTTSNTVTLGTAVYVAANGILGVGTSSPSTAGGKLTVQDTGTYTVSAWNATAVAANVGATYYMHGGVDANNLGFIGAYFTGSTTTGGGYLALGTRDVGGSTSEKARIDSSGNMGLAVTPSAWKSNYKAQQIGNATAIVGRTDNNNNYFSSNWYVNSSNQDIYLNTGYATLYSQGTGTHIWYTANSGTAGANISFTQVMALDASGNMGVGAASPTSGRRLTVSATSGDSAIRINAPTGYYSYLELTENGSLTSGNYWQIVKIPTTNVMQFWNGAERMTLDASGNLGIGGTGNSRLYVESSSSAHAIFRNTNGGSYTSLRLYNDTNLALRALEIDYYGSTNNERAEIFCTGAYPLLFGTNNTERARIDSNGNLVVGATSTRGTYKLDIRSDTSIAIGSNATYFGTIGYNAGTGLMSLAAESGGGINFLSGATERMRISSAGYVTAPYTPAFAALGLSNAQVNGYANDLPAPLLFNTVGVNTGSFYNSSTGRFTAPVAGVYYFSVSLLVDNNAGTGQVSYAQFYKNGASTSFTCYTQSPVGGYYTPMSQSCVLSLNANDYVTVQGLGGNIHIGSESAFTGFLIG